ncbi:MAG TPA: penicillin-binding protein 2, partial [Armatimonadetes bacterium]|nr:penicillin-binding protein 2 [Armatimonadota bacterium]
MERTPPWLTRVGAFAFLTFLLLFVLLGRLWNLQIVRGEEFYARSRATYVREVRMEAPRGNILDRKGRALATSRTAFNIIIVPGKDSLVPMLSPKLAKLLGVPEEEIRRRAGGKALPYMPIYVAEDVDISTLTKVEEHRPDLPGVEIETAPRRFYPYGQTSAHLIGYIGEVSKEELRRLKSDGYRPGDWIGKIGVERSYDRYLRGRPGRRLVMVDAYGRTVRILGVDPPKPGANVYLTIDLDLQRSAEEALKGRRGAFVALDPGSGAVLCMASSPSFDPNLFARRIRPEEWRRIIGNPAHPLQNRAVGASAPPGSAFKIITAAAGLYYGAITPQTVIHCPGGCYVGRRFFRCWRRHGAVNLVKAIRESCDTYFYQVALRVGPERLAKMARMFGLGERTGIDIPGEVRGLVPDPRWKRRRLKEPWFGGETANFGIGQGFLKVTPLQMALVAAAVANGGKVLRPFVVGKVVDERGKVIYKAKPKVKRRLPLAPWMLEVIRRGMFEVCNLPG